MSQADADLGINTTDNLVDVPLKRKRGRPRKYPKLNFDENVHIAKNRGKKHSETIPIPPSSRVNSNHSHPPNPIQNVADGMLGQAVSGVIEAVFEAGYLLCVRVGNSGITLRGVVFKPGHYVPVSAENDVAPDVQMVRRSTFPFATGNCTQIHGYNPRSKSSARPGSKHTPHHSNQEAFKVKSTCLSTLATLSSSRGNVVPVVLQPAKLTNGPPVATESFAIQTTLPTSKGKEALTGTFPSNESATPVGNENFSFQPQIGQQVVQDDASVGNNSLNQSSTAVEHDSKAESMTLPGTPFENLVTEVIKRIQAPSPSLSAEVQSEKNKAAAKISAKESENSSEIAANLVDGPLMIEPLNAVQPVHYESSDKAVDEPRTAKITELLQENMMQNDGPWNELQNPCQKLKSEELAESKAELGDGETGNEK